VDAFCTGTKKQPITTPHPINKSFWLDYFRVFLWS